MRSLTALAMAFAGLLLATGCAPPAILPAPHQASAADEPAEARPDTRADAIPSAPLPPPTAPAPELSGLVAAAKEHYRRGLEALEKGEVDEARAAFDSAVLVYLEEGPDTWDEGTVAAFEHLLQSIREAEAKAAELEETTPDDPASGAEADRLARSELSPEELAASQEKIEHHEVPIPEAPLYDVPIELTAPVVAYIEAFSGRRQKLFEPGMVRSGKYVPMIRRIFAEEGVPLDLCYLAHIESAYKPNAYSRARAKGLFQFIASTGRLYGLRSDWWVDMRSDPELSARAAARYLKALYAIYDDWYLSLAEYNGGTRVRRAWERSGRKADFWQLARGKSLRPETRNYVPQFVAAVVLHKEPKKYGFSLERAPEIVYDTVHLDSSLDLRVAARLAGTGLEELRQLNPALRRMATPPDYPMFPLRIPADRAGLFLAELTQLPASERLPWQEHRVAGGETLSSIAGRHGITVQALRSANHLKSSSRINIGQVLVIPGAGTLAPEAEAMDSGRSRSPGNTQVHRVRRGETLSSIARRYGISVANLMRWNGISDASRLQAGQRLRLRAPAEGSTRVAEASPMGGEGSGGGTVYRVQRGDTLYSIARRHQVSVDALRRWNGLGNSSTIHPGARLRIER